MVGYGDFPSLFLALQEAMQLCLCKLQNHDEQRPEPRMTNDLQVERKFNKTRLQKALTARQAGPDTAGHVTSLLVALVKNSCFRAFGAKK